MASWSSGHIPALPTQDALNRAAREVARIRKNSGHPEVTSIDMDLPKPLSSRSNSLILDAERLLRSVSGPESRVGRMPPQPPTMRAKIGAVLVRLVSRALFWYTPQINENDVRIAERLRQHAERITEVGDGAAKLAAAEQQFRAEIDGLHDADAQLRSDIRASRGLQEEVAAKTDQARAAQSELRLQLEAAHAMNAELRDRVDTLHGAQEQLRVELDEARALIRAMQEDREQLRDVLAELRQPIDHLSSSVLGIAGDLERVRDDGQQLQVRVNELTTRSREIHLYAHQTRTMLSAQQSRLAILADRQQRNGRIGQELPPSTAVTVTEPGLGSLGLEFDAAFRGPRSEIKERATIYLTNLRESRIGTTHTPVLDLGCGRGEWLELLAENNFVAAGVEGNRSLVDECHRRGFTVHHADALEFLRKTLSESQGAVTAFHVIEHLPFDMILAVFDEAARVLKPGGLLIVELPNPANLLVGAHTFYLDPTHIRPLPADLMRFIVESRGFTSVEVIPLHPYPDCYRLDENDNKPAAVLNELLYGPRDYAVIAHRL